MMLMRVVEIGANSSDRESLDVYESHQSAVVCRSILRAVGNTLCIRRKTEQRYLGFLDVDDADPLVSRITGGFTGAYAYRDVLLSNNRDLLYLACT